MLCRDFFLRVPSCGRIVMVQVRDFVVVWWLLPEALHSLPPITGCLLLVAPWQRKTLHHLPRHVHPCRVSLRAYSPEALRGPYGYVSGQGVTSTQAVCRHLPGVNEIQVELRVN